MSRQDSTATVCAVIVTHNRKELLLRNIQSLQKQEYPLDILVYDNASDDDTHQYLSQQGVSVDHFIRSEKNTGGAGGFSAGMQKAYELGYDYVWLMDDDGYCLNNQTLGKLMDQMITVQDGREQNVNRVILNSLVICDPKENGGDETLAFSLFQERKLTAEQAKKKVLPGEINPFNGTLISRQLMDEIGFVNAALYIYGDEIDYIERAKQVGYEVLTVPASRYYHPDSGMGSRKVFGKAVGIRSLTKERLYYYTRNYMYIMRKYRTKMQAVMHIPKILVKTLLYEDKGVCKLPTVVKALYDGWRL